MSPHLPTHSVCEPRKYVWLSWVRRGGWREQRKVFFGRRNELSSGHVRTVFVPLGCYHRYLQKCLIAAGEQRPGLVRAAAHSPEQPQEGSWGHGASHPNWLQTVTLTSCQGCTHFVLIHTSPFPCSRTEFECFHLGKFTYQLDMVKASNLM